ncbi:MAG: cytochrome PufQ [Pseudomonadota bacterium]
MSRLTPKARRRASKLEYGCYFAVIFLFSLPVALVRTLAGSSEPRADGAGAGVIGRAWSEARTVTPMIFSA